jgi:hypothetical protein
MSLATYLHLLGPGPLAEVKVETGEWRWSHLPAPWVLALIVVCVLLLARWLYAGERGAAGRGPRALLTGLRALALLLVVLAIAGPYREELRTAEEKGHLVVLLDTSTSMRNEDLYPPEEERRLLAAAWPESDPTPRPTRLAGAVGATRLGLSVRVLTANDGALLRRLAERFVLHVFAFDEDWRSLGSTLEVGEDRPGRPSNEGEADRVGEIVRALQQQAPNGPRTRIGVALRSVATQFLDRPDQPLAGVVLISDGQDTSEGETPLEVVTALPGARSLCVYAVRLGNPDSDKNLRVDPIRAKDVVLVRDQVLFEADLRHKGLAGAGPVVAQLEVDQIADAEGRPIPARRVTLPPGDRTRAATEGATLPAEETPLPVRLWAPFDEPGTYRVTIRAQMPPGREREDAILDDNAATHELRVVDTSIRVLYVDGEARWEMRFLSNYLTREAPTRTGSAGGGRRNRFLTHVLQQRSDPTVTLPHTPGPDIFRKALREFPNTREGLFAYDVLLLGDVDLRQLASGNAEGLKRLLELIRSFVEEGGGIALQAGTEYHNPLQMLGTPLADLLPLSVTEADRKATEAIDRSSAIRLRLTEAGRAHPAFNILPPDSRGERPDPERVARIWANEDERVDVSEGWAWFWGYRCLGGLRPGAVALATGFRPGRPDARDVLDGRDQPIVLMASKTFGKGRVFWLGLDDMWRIRKGNGDTYYGAFWEQVIRDLATYRLLGGNKRFKIFPKDDEVPVGETAEILITALDERYQPMDAPFLDGVHVELPDGSQPGDGGRIDLEGDARPERTLDSGGAPGEYRFRLPVTRPGTYLVWIEQRGDVRDAGERAERRFRGVARSREDALRLPNHQVLASLATETGGESVPLSALSELSPRAQSVSRVLNRTRKDQWDKAWVLWLLVGVLGLEWALRKRFQMI